MADAFVDPLAERIRQVIDDRDLARQELTGARRQLAGWKDEAARLDAGLQTLASGVVSARVAAELIAWLARNDCPCEGCRVARRLVFPNLAT